MKRKKRAGLFALALVLGLGGCVTPSLIRVGHHDYAPKPPDYVMKVYVGGQSVPHSYMEVCLFAYGGSDRHPARSAVSSVYLCMPQARQAGCDAIVVENADTDGIDLNPAGAGQGGMDIIEGIKFIDPSVQSKTLDPDELFYVHVK